MTKQKVIKKFSVIDDFFGETEVISWEMSKKGHSKMSSKIWPPVSEDLDPLVTVGPYCSVLYWIGLYTVLYWTVLYCRLYYTVPNHTILRYAILYLSCKQYHIIKQAYYSVE